MILVVRLLANLCRRFEMEGFLVILIMPILQTDVYLDLICLLADSHMLLQTVHIFCPKVVFDFFFFFHLN